MKTRTSFTIAVAVLAVLAAVSNRLQAQATRTRTVAVALVDTLSRASARAEILRFSDSAKPDIILLRRDADADALAAALISYRSSVSRTPSRPGLVGRTVVTDYDVRSADAARARGEAASAMARLRRTPVSRIGAYGRGQWTTLEVAVRE